MRQTGQRDHRQRHFGISISAPAGVSHLQHGSAPRAFEGAESFRVPYQKSRGAAMFRSTWSRIIVSGVALVGTTGLFYWLKAAVAAPAPQSLVEFTADGKLKIPEGYRKWVYIGTPLTPNELNNGEARFNEFHNVYIDPESFAHFEKTGQFRDGTVIIKELVRIGSKEATSGKGYFMGDFAGLESSIKDSKRFERRAWELGLLQLWRTQIPAQERGRE